MNISRAMATIYDTQYTTPTVHSVHMTTASLSQTQLLEIYVYTAIAIVVMYLISSPFIAGIFKKAGQPRWKAWVPVYRKWTLLNLAHLPGPLALLEIVPYVSIVPAVLVWVAMYRLSPKFGKSPTFFLWGLFLPIVWYVWLALDKSVWNEQTNPHQPISPSSH